MRPVIWPQVAAEFRVTSWFDLDESFVQDVGDFEKYSLQFNESQDTLIDGNDRTPLYRLDKSCTFLVLPVCVSRFIVLS